MELFYNEEDIAQFYNFKNPLPNDEFFEFRPLGIPSNGQPILDEETGSCIGYSVLRSRGIWEIYDSNGSFIRLEESPLESPIIAPSDLILVGAGVFKAFKYGKSALKATSTSALNVRIASSTKLY